MIEVILDKSFINDFGNINSELGRLIEKILLNENNVFIVNDELFTYIENTIDGNIKFKWEDYFTYLSDNNKIKVSQNNTLDTKIIFNEGQKEFDYVIVLKNEHGIASDDSSCNLQLNSTNDIFFRDLLEKNQISLRNFHFDNNTSIKNFFKKLFNCSKTNQRVIIIARYNNFGCDLIEELKNKFRQKSFWTTYKGHFDPSTNFSNLQSQLGNSLMLFTGNNSQIHERKIIIGNLIIEFDDDFNKITADVDTWKCDCSVDKNLAVNLKSKQSRLRRIQG